ncbi:MAG: hypothetical protein ACRD2R_02535 [Terriglobales bacterium]
MQAEFTVELGADDDSLEVPWASEDGALRYYDLRRQPELLLNIEEAHHNRELGEFLSAINSGWSVLETAKCDIWASAEMSEEESVYGAAWKFGSYVDLIFTEPAPRLEFEAHEEFAGRAAELLRRVPEIPAAAEFVVRRCTYHPEEPRATAHVGYCVTFYLYGYGDDESDARRRWGIAMKVVENALLQLSAAQRKAAARGR